MTANVDTLYRLAGAQVRDRQFERAATTLSSLLMLAPRHAGARLLQAGIALREDRYRIAHAHILTVAASPPADAATEYDLFQRLRTFNEHALMIDSAQRLLSLKPIDIGQQMQVASSLSGIGAPELAERLCGPVAPVVVDVRAAGEFAGGHIPGVIHIPVPDLRFRHGELDPDAPCVMVCNVGQRASLAASLLKQRGFRDVMNLAGGMTGYNAATDGGACPVCALPHGPSF